jgi:hypothetical protein
MRNVPTFWPALPVMIWYPHLRTASHTILTPGDEDTISDILNLKNPARIREIDLDITPSLLAKIALSLKKSFPALDHLRLRSQVGEGDLDPIVLPNDFLGGVAPRLCVLHLKGVAIPMLPRLLSSSKNLVSLQMEDIKIAGFGFFRVEDLAIGLSTATQLKFLELSFHSRTMTTFYSPRLRGPSPRVVLPSLTEFRYAGESGYLRYLVSWIDTPIIEQISVSFGNARYYDHHELCELFGLGDVLRSSHCRATQICLSTARTIFSHHFARIPSSPGLFRLQLPYRTAHPVPTLVALVCLGLESQDALPKVIHLEIEDFPEPLRQYPACWLNLFRALTGLKTLYVSSELSSVIASALAQVPGETILPALKELHFGLDTPSSTTAPIAPFIAQRQLCGLPVSVHFRKLNGLGHAGAS